MADSETTFNATVINQDGVKVVVKGSKEENDFGEVIPYIDAEIRKLTAKPSGVDYFIIVAEAAGDDDGDEVILGVYFDRAEAESGLEMLEAFYDVYEGDSMSAVDFLKATGEYDSWKGVALDDVTALEFLQ